MPTFIPEAPIIEEQWRFEDKLPMHSTSISVARRRVQITEFLTAKGAGAPIIQNGHVGGRDAFKLSFTWRDQKAMLVMAALPFQDNFPSKKLKEQARRQALATLYEYLRYTMNIRSFMPDIEPFAAFMLPPGGGDGITIGSVIHRVLTDQANGGALLLPAPPSAPGEDVFVVEAP